MKELNTITPELFPDSNWTEYKFTKAFDCIDRIYYSKCNPILTANILEAESELFVDSYAYDLVGSIEDERRIVKDSPLYESIKDTLKNHLEEYLGLPVLDLSFDKDNGITDIWINKMFAHEFNPLHNHGGMFSFVWYLDVPTAVQEEPSPRGRIQFVAERYVDQMVFSPQTNDLLLFDARQRHIVYPFTSSYPRYTMAGNIHGVKYE